MTTKSGNPATGNEPQLTETEKKTILKKLTIAMNKLDEVDRIITQRHGSETEYGSDNWDIELSTTEIFNELFEYRQKMYKLLGKDYKCY